MLLGVLLAGCAPAPPNHPLDICKIYSQYPKWYWASEASYQKWGVAPPVQMAIIYQESSYQAYAKPSRGKLLWIIPWKRPSTATGYAQATDGSWENYMRHTGNFGASRHDFSDAVDFIGWYAATSEKHLGISRQDPYQLYLAYHNGFNGRPHRSAQQKQWLLKIAQHVEKISERYSQQFARCKKALPQKHWWNF
jgi:hypothetical protein